MSTGDASPRRAVDDVLPRVDGVARRRRAVETEGTNALALETNETRRGARRGVAGEGARAAGENNGEARRRRVSFYPPILIIARLSDAAISFMPAWTLFLTRRRL